MEKNTIYIRVGKMRHTFRVPKGITLEAIIENFKGQLGLNDVPTREIRAAVFTPLGTPLDDFKIEDGSEIIILTNTMGDEIDYKGVEKI